MVKLRLKFFEQLLPLLLRQPKDFEMVLEFQNLLRALVKLELRDLPDGQGEIHAVLRLELQLQVREVKLADSQPVAVLLEAEQLVGQWVIERLLE